MLTQTSLFQITVDQILMDYVSLGALFSLDTALPLTHPLEKKHTSFTEIRFRPDTFDKLGRGDCSNSRPRTYDKPHRREPLFFEGGSSNPQTQVDA